jgi:hypothetical protein
MSECVTHETITHGALLGSPFLMPMEADWQWVRRDRCLGAGALESDSAAACSKRCSSIPTFSGHG